MRCNSLLSGLCAHDLLRSAPVTTANGKSRQFGVGSLGGAKTGELKLLAGVGRLTANIAGILSRQKLVYEMPTLKCILLRT